jgi:TIR domain-containing protein
LKTTTPETRSFLIDPDAKGFTREIRTFWIGVALGLVPFFGEIPIPGFHPLLQIFPEDLRLILLVVGPLSMGFVAAAVKFQLGERTDRKKLPRWLWTAVLGSLLGLFALLYMQRYVARVPTDNGHRLVIIGESRLPTCRCGVNPGDRGWVSNEVCISGLLFELDTCWDYNERENIKLGFGFDYLFVNLGIGVVAGVLMLQRKLAQLEAAEQGRKDVEERARQARERKSPKKRTTRRLKGESVGPSGDLPARAELPAAAADQSGQLAPPPEVAAAELVARRELERKRTEGVFDVFLCHNSDDKPEVKKIGKHLEKRGILPWLDEWELRPGQPWQSLLEQQVANIKSAAVFVGSAGVGPWQEQELNGFLREFVSRKSPVIPVLLSNAPKEPKLPLFLRAYTWVDFRVQDPDPLDGLIWGITGKHPKRLGE